MSVRVHGHVSSGSHIVPSMQFHTIYTVISCSDSADYQVNGQTDVDVPNAGRNLERFSQVFLRGAFPAILTLSSTVVDLSVPANATFYGFGSNYNQAATTVYAIKIASERPFVWGGAVADVAALATSIVCSDPASVGSLANALQGTPLPFSVVAGSVPGQVGDITAVETVSATTRNTVVNFYSLL